MLYRSYQNRLTFNSRLARIFILVSICATIIVLRLFYLQIIKASDFMWLGEKNFRRTEAICSPRGNITDAYGNLLATNRPVLTLYWQGTGNVKLTASQCATLEKLTQYLPSLPPLHEILQAERFSKHLPLLQDPTNEQLATLIEQFPEHENLSIHTSFERYYPHQNTGCHLVGYLGSINVGPIGKMGLEKVFEPILKGDAGIVEKTINSLGKKLSERQLKNVSAGDHIQTNIDLAMQVIAEKAFPNNYAGAFLVMEAKTGALRAVVSRPSFDPNMFLKRISQKEWENLQANQPFINRAFGACYPPASPFKLITFTAAFDLGLIDEETTWDCKGFVVFGKRKHYCNKRTGHGTLTAKQALAQSCNIPCFELAKQISIDSLAEYAHKFGLGQPTHCIFPEKTGLLPTNAWKEEVKGEPWWPGETLSASIGQSYLLATPLQMVRMVGGIVEGNLMRPRILAAEPIEETPLEIDEKVRKFLKRSMRMAVTTGTGIRLSRLENIKIYAKTGTAQVSSLYKRNKQATDKEHAWCIIYIKYKDKEPLCIAILLEHAGAARRALETAKTFLQNYTNLT